MIGVALVTLPPFEWTPIAAHFFYAAMESGLRVKGVEPTGSGGLFGPVFVAWIMPAPCDRNPVLRAIKQVMTELGWWALCELAFFDQAEGYWRTVHQPFHPLNEAPSFGRFLAPARIQAMRERLRTDQEMLEAWPAEIRRLIDNGELQI
jgi:hypothetical protein